MKLKYYISYNWLKTNSYNHVKTNHFGCIILEGKNDVTGETIKKWKEAIEKKHRGGGNDKLYDIYPTIISWNVMGVQVLLPVEYE